MASRTSLFSIGQVIVLVTAAVLLIAGLVVGLGSLLLRHEAMNSWAREEARETSQLVFAALYSAMQRGAGGEELEQIARDISAEQPDLKVDIYRGFPVIRQFGDNPEEAPQRARDPHLSAALDGQEELVTDMQAGTLRFLYPVPVREACTACHDATPGQINGVVDVTYPVTQVSLPLHVVRFYALAMFVLFAVGGAGVLFWAQRRFIARPMHTLSEVLGDLSTNPDLSRRAWVPSRIREVHTLTHQFNRMLERLQDSQARLEDLSARDPLTRLSNRSKFEEALGQEVQRARRHGLRFALVMLDLDNFKHINDTFGHPVGDMVLKELAAILRTNTRKTDTLARLGGDEFAVLLPETALDQGEEVAEKLRQVLSETQVTLPEGKVTIHASLGLVGFPESGDTYESLTIAMDVAMYKAKRGGKNRVARVEGSERESVMHIFAQGNFIRSALEEQRVVGFLQPIVNTRDGTVHAYEVLARVSDGEDYISAGRFIEAAEELGLTERIDDAVFRDGLRWLAERSPGSEGPALFFNLSSKSFGNMEKMRRVPQQLRDLGLHPARVVFEITEREALPHMSELIAMIEALRAEGFRFALDDFGSGFSSFLYLKYLNVDIVKIEGNFIRTIAQDWKDRVMVEHIHNMARAFGLDTVAELVEDATIHRIICDMGIPHAQGFWYGRPQPAETVPGGPRGSLLPRDALGE